MIQHLPYARLLNSYVYFTRYALTAVLKQALAVVVKQACFKTAALSRTGYDSEVSVGARGRIRNVKKDIVCAVLCPRVVTEEKVGSVLFVTHWLLSLSLCILLTAVPPHMTSPLLRHTAPTVQMKRNNVASMQCPTKQQPIRKIYTDGEYEGNLNGEGERTGRGIMKYSEGDVYEGEWNDDMMEGVGTMVYADGDKFTGSFIQGNFHGVGEYFYKNGDHYKGEWKNDAFDGEGMYSDHKGSKYEGMWKEDKMHGRGKYLDAAGNLYDGTFYQGKFHGAGKLNYVNGDYYEGEFRQGKRDGQGKCVDVDRNTYEGMWSDNKRNGYGNFRDVMGGVYKGHYKKGIRDGPGTYLWPEGQIDVTICKDDVRVGIGVGWSADRKRAWRMVDGEYVADLPLLEAHQVVRALGIDPEEIIRL